MSFSRRAFARLAVTGAAGLALLRPQRLLADDSILEKWARLGRVWREMSAHWRSERGDREQAQKAFGELKAEMAEALDALPASEELRTAFEQRHAHIQRSRYLMATCYRMAPAGNLSQRSRGEIEKQAQELEALASDGTLSREAMRKAAQAMAAPIEYLTRMQATRELPDDERREEEKKLVTLYRSEMPAANGPAKVAGQRAAELSTDRLGELAGKPDEGE